MLSELEKKIVRAVQKDVPVRRRPFLEMATSLGITEESFLQTLRRLCETGVIRRFGATLRHQKSGFAANALAAWQVPEERVEAAGRIMAAFPQVSHCFCRKPTGRWPYNLYTMIHAADEEGCRETARQMTRKTGIKTCVLLFSRKELKKTSMEYFPPNDEKGKISAPL